jgi:aryl-alcohol dehydrogenase-like predicted oxidoreductase
MADAFASREGLPTGKIDTDTTFRQHGFPQQRSPGFDVENRKANQALVDVLSRFCRTEKATPAQIITQTYRPENSFFPAGNASHS